MSVPVVEQRAEVGSTRRVPLGRRVVATLESAQSILHTGRIPDEDLGRIRDGDRHAALRQVEKTTTAAVSSLASGPSRTVRVLSVQQLLAELHSHWYEIQQELLARQIGMMDGVREALHRLRSAETMPQIIDRVAVEACRSCGVDRCVLMVLREGRLLPDSVHFGRAPTDRNSGPHTSAPTRPRSTRTTRRSSCFAATRRSSSAIRRRHGASATSPTPRSRPDT
jgi:hypothetical protein